MAQSASKKATATKGESSGSTRRDEILTVAAKVIAERGIKQATVRDIGEAAGILSGSLYYHFESKDQIVLELLLPSIEHTYGLARQICDESSGIEAVRRLIENAVLATAASPDRSLILRNEARIFAELDLLTPIDEFRAKIVGLWINAMEEGKAAGEIRPAVDVEIVSRAMLDGTLGASRWFNGAREADTQVVIDNLSDFYISGLQQH